MIEDMWKAFITREEAKREHDINAEKKDGN